MIEKNLFLLWVGDDKPPYIDNVINAYKYANNDFNICFMHVKPDDIEKSNDKYIKKTFEYIEATLRYNTKNKYYDYIKLMTTKSKFQLERQFRSYFSDILRHELIENEGGIFVDCDTFPIKPFDETLLVADHFNAFCPWREFFFFGAKKGINSWLQDYKYAELKKKSLYDSMNYKGVMNINNCRFSKLKEKLLDSTIRYGEHFLDTNHYIDHYYLRSWKAKNKPIPTIYDELFNTKV